MGNLHVEENIKMDPRERCGMDSTGSIHCSVAGSCECDNEP